MKEQGDVLKCARLEEQAEAFEEQTQAMQEHAEELRRFVELRQFIRAHLGSMSDGNLIRLASESTGSTEIQAASVLRICRRSQAPPKRQPR